jgi:hypothetical protein
MTNSASLVWDLVNPEGAARLTSLTPAARPEGLDGKTVGLAWNGKPGGEEALEEIARLLAQRVSDIRFIKYWQEVPESVAPRELTQETLSRMAARKPDLVIVSQAD